MILMLCIASVGAEFIRASQRSPIFVMGFGKTGTTSLYRYFQCGGYRVSHWKCLPDLLCGRCLFDNYYANRPLLTGCGDYEVYTQLDATEPPDNCFYPQTDLLDELHQQHPLSPWILNTRPFNHWLSSVMHWNNLTARLIGCGSIRDNTTEEFRNLYYERLNRVRKFWTTHKSHAFVEVNIESPYAAHILFRHFGINTSCWSDANSNLKQ